MRGKQIVTIVGTVVQEPKEFGFKRAGEGRTGAKTTVVVNDVADTHIEGWKPRHNGDQGSERGTFMRVAAFEDRLAEQIMKSNVPDCVLVQGELVGETTNGSQNPRVWFTRDGDARSSFELKVTAWVPVWKTFQQVHIIGNLGKDPEMQYTEQGVAYTKVSVATTEFRAKTEKRQVGPEGWKVRFDGSGNKAENIIGWTATIWWRVTFWGKLAEIVNEHLNAGRRVYIIGRMGGNVENGVCSPFIWTNQETGVPGTGYELTADCMVFLPDSKNGNGNGKKGGRGAEKYENSDEFNELSAQPFNL